MKAAVLRKHNDPYRIEEIEIAPPREGEVKVRIRATGVCHTDLSILKGAMPFYQLPHVGGHESAGVVTEVGPGVTRVKEGDHVIPSWYPYCGSCRQCSRGEPTSCRQILGRQGVQHDGTTRLSINGEPVYRAPDAGTFAEEAIFHERNVVRISKEIPFDVAALIGCAVTTGFGAVLNTAGVEPGDRVAVIGCGGVGLNVIQGARLAGATTIIAIDLLQPRLDAARKFGATETVDASKADAVVSVMDATEGDGADYVFECAGSNKAQADSLRMIRWGGASVFVGVAPALMEQVGTSAGLMTLLGQRIIGSFFGSCVPDRDFPKMADLWQAGMIDISSLITHRIGLEELNGAFEWMSDGTSLRTVIEL